MAKKRPARNARTGKTPEREVSERHREWYRQHMAGERHSDIATAARVSRAAVSKAIRRVEQIVASEFTAEISKYRGRCTIRLEYLYAEAVREWHRSKEPIITDKVGQSAGSQDAEFDDGRESYAIERTTKSQTGNPGLHAAALKSVEKLMELHGIRYVETMPETDEADDIAGLTTVEQVDQQIRKQKGDIKRLSEYREMVVTMEGA